MERRTTNKQRPAAGGETGENPNEPDARETNEVAKIRRLTGWLVEGIRESVDPSLLPDGNGPWQVVLLSAEAARRDEAGRNRGLLRHAVRNAIAELLPGAGFEHGETIVLLQPASRSDQESRRRKLAVKCVEDTLDCRITLVAGIPVLRPEQLHRSYVTARESLAYLKSLAGSQGRHGGSEIGGSDGP